MNPRFPAIPPQPTPQPQLPHLGLAVPPLPVLQFLAGAGAIPIWLPLGGNAFLEASSQVITYATGGVTITMPRPMPNNVLAVIPIANDANLLSVIWTNALAFDRTKFGVKCYAPGGAETANGAIVRVAWAVIGY